MTPSEKLDNEVHPNSVRQLAIRINPDDVRNFAASLATSLEPAIAFVATLSRSLQILADALIPQLAAFKTGVRSLEEYRKEIEHLSRRLESIERDFPSYVEAMAMMSWFPDDEMGIHDMMMFGASNHLSDDIDSAASDYFRERATAIIRDVSLNFPNRAACLNEAMSVYRNGLFYPATTAFLAQADGICQELTKYSFFSKANSIRKTREFVNSIDDRVGVNRVFLFPLAERIPIEGDKNVFNRNAIQHGEDCQSSEIYCLKAISLVGYLGIMVKDIIDEAEAASSAPQS